MKTKRVHVVAALIWENEKFMICKRPPDKLNPLLWEFVGGKVEEGESDHEALKREVREELGIEILPKEKVIELTHQYPELKVDLSLYEAEILSGTPQLKEHFDLKWISPEEIDNFEFCAADTEILEKIKNKVIAP